MSTLMECEGCSTAYDVSKRQPGKKVRCPRCKTINVVPERDMEDSAVVKASAHLRKSRGPDCRVHKTTASVSTCKLCSAPMCKRCLSPAPVDHACRSCAKGLELEGALPVDFGYVTTLRLSFSVFFKNILRIFAWGLLAIFVTLTVCGIPLIVGAVMARGADGPGLTQQLGVGLVILSLIAIYVLKNFTLLPAGCTVFVDDSMRGRRETFAEGFTHAWRRVTNRTGSLFLILAIYAMLSFLITLFGLVVCFYTDQALGGIQVVNGQVIGSTAPIFLLIFILGAGLLFLAAGLGLAVPVTVLEQRSAFDSMARAWQLARQRFWTLCAIVLTFFFIFGVVYVASLVVSNLIGLPLLAAFFTFLVDLFWPAMLTAAYHGLAAEEAGVLGRGK